MNVSFPTRLTQATTSHPVEVGFSMLTLGTHSTASFLGLSHLSHSVHFFGRTVVSSMHCGCSNPGSNLGQGSILLSGSRNMTLLFATSSYSWILCLKLTGALCCLPAAKTAGRLQTEVLAQNHGKCPRATYFMPKLSWLQEGSTGLQ